MRRRESLDTIENVYDQVEEFVCSYIKDEKENIVARTAPFSDVVITDTEVHVPLYGVASFTVRHKQQFEAEFQGGRLEKQRARPNKTCVKDIVVCIVKRSSLFF